MNTKYEYSIYLIEDDNVLRETIKATIESIKHIVVAFSSANEFLDYYHQTQVTKPLFGCIVLDVRLPGMNGMGLLEELHKLEEKIPIIFMSGHADIPTAVEAMEKGAFGFLEKPFREQALLEKVSGAIRKSKEYAEDLTKHQSFSSNLGSLTERERNIFDLAVQGDPNKVIASKLNISERTVEVHRSNMLKKFDGLSLNEIIKKYVDYNGFINKY